MSDILDNFTSLAVLNLANNNISDQGAIGISKINFRVLNELNLESNTISFIGLKWILDRDRYLGYLNISKSFKIYFYDNLIDKEDKEIVEKIQSKTHYKLFLESKKKIMSLNSESAQSDFEFSD